MMLGLMVHSIKPADVPNMTYSDGVQVGIGIGVLLSCGLYVYSGISNKSNDEWRKKQQQETVVLAARYRKDIESLYSSIFKELDQGSLDRDKVMRIVQADFGHTENKLLEFNKALNETIAKLLEFENNSLLCDEKEREALQKVRHALMQLRRVQNLVLEKELEESHGLQKKLENEKPIIKPVMNKLATQFEKAIEESGDLVGKIKNSVIKEVADAARPLVRQIVTEVTNERRLQVGTPAQPAEPQ